MIRRPGFLRVDASVDDDGRISVNGWGLQMAGDARPMYFPTTGDLREHLAIRTPTPLRLFVHGDREVIAQLVDGYRDVRFQVVRGGVVLASSIHDGQIILQNIEPLFGGARLEDVAAAAGRDFDHRAPVDAQAASVMPGILAIASRMHETIGQDPLTGNRKTSAGLAFAALTAAHGNPTVDLRAHDAFRGGRCEARTLRKVRATLWDVNSSYAQSFREAPPTDKLMLCRVRVNGDVPPCFDHDNDRLTFPVGTFRTWIWASTYDRALEGAGVRILKAEESYPVDFRWMREAGQTLATWYDERAAATARGDRATALALKGILVASYGKLGLNGQVELASVGHRAPREGVYYKLGDREFLRFKTLRHVTNTRANYPYAAWIADNARIRLYEGLRDTGFAAHYWDSDAMLLYPGAKPGNVGTGLGQWKKVRTADLQVFDQKDYQFGGTVKRKGGEHVKSIRLKTWAKSGTAHEAHRTRRHVYEARQVLSDGGTAPLEIHRSF